MTLVETVQRSRSPKEAMLEIAAELDALVERVLKLENATSWDSWDDGTVNHAASDEWNGGSANSGPTGTATPAATFKERHEAAVAAMVNDKPHDIQLPAPSREKINARQDFARNRLRLEGEQWAAYVKGGPLWFYMHDRDAFMQYDFETRREMVADVDEDDKEQARLMSLDVLKRDSVFPTWEGTPVK